MPFNKKIRSFFTLIRGLDDIPPGMLHTHQLNRGHYWR